MIFNPALAYTAAALLATSLVLGWLLKSSYEDAAVDKQERQQLLASLNTERSQRVAMEAVLSARVESKARIQTVTKEIIREVPVRIPAAACPIDGGYRVLHDAAARGEVPAPAGGPDAAPVAVEDAANTVVENYGQYHDLADQLRKLQQACRGE